MRESVLKKVPRVLKEKLDGTKKYVAAVSGGADSVALAEGLWQAGFTFAVCHVEHGIRGRESLEDAEFVEAFCRERDIPFYCKTVRAVELSEREKLSLEDAARRLRYEALLRCADEIRADFILTAHQKDDQAETFLLRLLRGSGTRGLGAIRFQRDRILRPLLSLTGKELRDYCSGRGIAWREDRTNQDLTYARNRVRNVLVPLLKENFSPSVTDILCRTAEHLRTDSLYLEKLAEKELRNRILPVSSGQKGALDTAGWEKIPEALRFRMLRLFWQNAGGEQELSSLNLHDLELLIEKRRSGKKILLPGSWQALHSYDKLLIFPSEYLDTLKKDGWFYEIPWDQIPRESGSGNAKKAVVPFPDGRMAELCIRRGKPSYKYRYQMIYPLAPLQRMGGALTFRYRKPEDQIFPLKGTGHKTLKKYLIECRVPVETRNRLVVLAIGSEILWIPGIANAGWDPDGYADDRSRDWLFINIME